MATHHLFQMKLCMNVRLSPYFSQHVRVGIENLMNKALLRHVPEARGILLAYENLELVDKTAQIIHEDCEAHFRIRCDALVFRVQRHIVLEGTINKVSSNHIGLLVHGLFNASIAVDQLRLGVSFDAEAGEWIDESGGSAMEMNTEMEGDSDADADADVDVDVDVDGTVSPKKKRKKKSKKRRRSRFRVGTRMLFEVVGLRTKAGLVSIAGTMQLSSPEFRVAAAALEKKEYSRQKAEDARELQLAAEEAALAAAKAEADAEAAEAERVATASGSGSGSEEDVDDETSEKTTAGGSSAEVEDGDGETETPKAKKKKSKKKDKSAKKEKKSKKKKKKRKASELL